MDKSKIVHLWAEETHEVMRMIHDLRRAGYDVQYTITTSTLPRAALNNYYFSGFRTFGQLMALFGHTEIEYD